MGNSLIELPIQICMAASLGDQVRKLRKARGWSQQDLAVRTGGELDQTAISRIETRDGYEPGIFTVATVARALGVTLDQLIEGVMPPAPPVEAETAAPFRNPWPALLEIQKQLDGLRDLVEPLVEERRGAQTKRSRKTSRSA